MTNDLLRLVDPALRLDLRAALFRAAESGVPVEVAGAPVTLDGETRVVDLRVVPVTDVAPGFLLVVFAARSPAPGEHKAVLSLADESVTQQFERELDQVRGQLRSTVEQYEASNEEMKASNEELQAMNEELRSASEELETSREELQSINEELVTVNQEMKSKVDELAHTNSDLQNLMASTSIATVFLDRNMEITRYTPSLTGAFYVIPSDVGRPLAHIKHRLDYPSLLDDAAGVLRTLLPAEREVTSDDHRWYLARLQPYRTPEDQIAGVVITFVDVTERKRIERALEADLEVSERLRKTSERLVPEGGMQALYDEIVDAAVVITDAATGTLSLLDPATRELRLLAAKGLSPEMARRFEAVAAGSATSCGVALASGQHTVVDFDAPGAYDPAGDLRAHLDAGLRSAQSTPLTSRSGQPIGMLTTHWREHRRATERERRFVDLLARQAADAMERQLANEVLHAHMEELTRFNDAAVGREARMLELKQEINTLLARQGEPARYPLDLDPQAGGH